MERVPDSLTHVFTTRAGREVRDGGGITPDVEVAPDTIANIVVYLDRGDSLEVTHDWVVDYISKHQTIAPAREFSINDAEYEDYKQKVVESGFTYDPVSGKSMDELEKILKFEGYYDDAKEELSALRKKLKHDVARDLDKHKDEIKQMLEREIIAAYYYKSGVIESGLKYDKQLIEAVKILNDDAAYSKLLKPKQ